MPLSHTLRTASLYTSRTSISQTNSTLRLQLRAMSTESKSLLDIGLSSWADYLLDLNIESTDIKTATGVSLTDSQKTIVGSVLDVVFSSWYIFVMLIYDSCLPAVHPWPNCAYGPTTLLLRILSRFLQVERNTVPNGTACKQHSPRSSNSTMKSLRQGIPLRWIWKPNTLSRVWARKNLSRARYKYLPRETRLQKWRTSGTANYQKAVFKTSLGSWTLLRYLRLCLSQRTMSRIKQREISRGIDKSHKQEAATWSCYKQAIGKSRKCIPNNIRLDNEACTSILLSFLTLIPFPLKRDSSC